MKLTGLKDTDREILSKLESDRDLLNACAVNKYAWKLCDDDFFRNRLASKYPDTIKYKNRKSWKEYYLKTIFYISRMFEEYNFVYKTGDPQIYYDIMFKTLHIHNEIYKAAANNYLDLVNFYLDNNPDFRALLIGNVLSGAASTNNMEMIQRFLKEASLDVLNQGLRSAVKHMNLDLAIFFIKNGANDLQSAKSISMSQFHLDFNSHDKFMKYLRDFHHI